MVLPKFLIKKTPKQKNINHIRNLICDHSIHTVCESAKCPNIGECFSQNTLTFMILGNSCTRNCSFCGISKGSPSPVDPEEPKRIARAVKKLGLNYVVITSVTRDDLPDGGASHFAAVINELQATNNEILTEVLIPDFQGNETALKVVLAARPYVLNHNIETVPRLYPKIRPQANYQQSLNLIRKAKTLKKSTLYTKSGFMVGLGERREEIIAVLEDLKNTDCNIVTIGQYLPPSREHLQPERYVHPDEFNEFQKAGEKMGLKVFAGPFVRSSYQAKKVVNNE